MESIGHVPQIALLLLGVLMVAFYGSAATSLIWMNKSHICHFTVTV